MPPHHFKGSQMETVKRSELSIIKMTDGNENKYQTVIDNGVVKEWVGIGWIVVRNVEPSDYEKFPVVE